MNWGLGIEERINNISKKIEKIEEHKSWGGYLEIMRLYQYIYKLVLHSNSIGSPKKKIQMKRLT